MPRETGSPQDWLLHARSDLGVVRGPVGPEVLTQTRCFHAQQVVEKCLKAVLLAHGTEFPLTHNLRTLLLLLPGDLPAPPEVEAAAALSVYAVAARYPGEFEPLSEEEFGEVQRLAEAVLVWAEDMVAQGRA